MKELSIVIPVYNNWKLTARCIASILKSDYPQEKYEIIVVDNASVDHTPSLLKLLSQQGYPLKTITNTENRGYLLGANQGWQRAKTEYVLHLNNDVTLDKKCISLMRKVFNMDEKIGIAGAVQYFPNGTREPPLRWFYRGEGDIGNIYRTELNEKQEQTAYVKCDVVGFACAMVKREVWEKIGFFDEKFVPAMYEQEDYCLRAKEAGYKTLHYSKYQVIR